MEFLVLAVLVIALFYYLKTQINKYEISQYKRKQELQQQEETQKIEKIVSELKGFVLDDYGSDGGYKDFKISKTVLETSNHFTGLFADPKWTDRDGHSWKMQCYNIGYGGFPNDPSYDPMHDIHFKKANSHDVNKLAVEMNVQGFFISVFIEGDDCGGTRLGWSFYLKHTFWRYYEINKYFSSNQSDYKVYKTPYQAKLAAKTYIEDSLSSLDY